VFPIAQGGMSSVWAAYEHGAQGLRQLVALKIISPDLEGFDFQMMFREEARLAARIHHPNVCEIFGLVAHEGLLALSMEWIDGGTLAEILAVSNERGLLDPRVAAQIVAHAARGLHAAHELCDDNGAPMHLVHRDVSPQNILIARDGAVKVTDFGIAKALGRAHGATAVGTVKGKLGYMSPEQAQGKALDRRSDIFSLGVILYTASLGVHPFRRPGESRKRQFERLLLDTVTPPTELAFDFPKGLEVILLRALSRRPADRFASADELRRELQGWIVQTGPVVNQASIGRVVAGRIGPPVREWSKEPGTRIRTRSRQLDLLSMGRPAQGLDGVSIPAAPLDATPRDERPTVRPGGGGA
jgi:serine/threonine-protein kinase